MYYLITPEEDLVLDKPFLPELNKLLNASKLKLARKSFTHLSLVDSRDVSLPELGIINFFYTFEEEQIRLNKIFFEVFDLPPHLKYENLIGSVLEIFNQLIGDFEVYSFYKDASFKFLQRTNENIDVAKLLGEYCLKSKRVRRESYDKQIGIENPDKWLTYISDHAVGMQLFEMAKFLSDRLQKQSLNREVANKINDHFLSQVDKVEDQDRKEYFIYFYFSFYKSFNLDFLTSSSYEYIKEKIYPLIKDINDQSEVKMYLLLSLEVLLINKFPHKFNEIGEEALALAEEIESIFIPEMKAIFFERLKGDIPEALSIYIEKRKDLHELRKAYIKLEKSGSIRKDVIANFKEHVVRKVYLPKVNLWHKLKTIPALGLLGVNFSQENLILAIILLIPYLYTSIYPFIHYNKLKNNESILFLYSETNNPDLIFGIFMVNIFVYVIVFMILKLTIILLKKVWSIKDTILMIIGFFLWSTILMPLSTFICWIVVYGANSYLMEDSSFYGFSKDQLYQGYSEVKYENISEARLEFSENSKRIYLYYIEEGDRTETLLRLEGARILNAEKVSSEYRQVSFASDRTVTCAEVKYLVDRLNENNVELKIEPSVKRALESESCGLKL